MSPVRIHRGKPPILSACKHGFAPDAKPVDPGFSLTADRWGPDLEFKPEKAIDGDQRERVDDSEIDRDYRSYCQLVMTDNLGDRWLGTGFLVSPQTVCTAAHNLVNYRSVKVTLGLHGSNAAPSQLTDRRNWEWTSSFPNDVFEDYAFIQLPQPFPAKPNQVFFWPAEFTMDRFSDWVTTNRIFEITGYPIEVCNQPGGRCFGNETSLFRRRQSIRGSIFKPELDPRVMMHKLDASRGQSGAPLVIANEIQQAGQFRFQNFYGIHIAESNEHEFNFVRVVTEDLVEKLKLMTAN